MRQDLRLANDLNFQRKWIFRACTDQETLLFAASLWKKYADNFLLSFGRCNVHCWAVNSRNFIELNYTNVQTINMRLSVCARARSHRQRLYEIRRDDVKHSHFIVVGNNFVFILVCACALQLSCAIDLAMNVRLIMWLFFLLLRVMNLAGFCCMIRESIT